MAVPCADCGKLAMTPRKAHRAVLCYSCIKTREQARNAARTHYSGSWKTTSANTRKQHPFCSWCGSTKGLELDHVSPRSLAAGTAVLCHPCHVKKTAGRSVTGAVFEVIR